MRAMDAHVIVAKVGVNLSSLILLFPHQHTVLLVCCLPRRTSQRALFRAIRT